MTGAIEVPMSKTEAEKITMSIKLLLGSLADVTDKVFDQIEKAKAGDAWKVLDYQSWTAYVTAEFGDALRRLNRGDRFLAVVKMRELGMSTRAIGDVVGVDDRTVRRDLSGAANAAPAEVTGKDGKTYPPARILPSGKVDAATVEAIGKAVPPVRRRTPFHKSVLAASVDLRRLVGRIRKLSEDDRFQKDLDGWSRQLFSGLTHEDRAVIRAMAFTMDDLDQPARPLEDREVHLGEPDA